MVVQRLNDQGSVSDHRVCKKNNADVLLGSCGRLQGIVSAIGTRHLRRSGLLSVNEIVRRVQAQPASSGNDRGVLVLP